MTADTTPEATPSDRYTPFKSHAGCDTAAIHAVRLLEDAEELHANCEECEGEGVPELCEVCFPHFDAARVQRRLVMQSLDALATPPTPSAKTPAQPAGREAIAEIIRSYCEDGVRAEPFGGRLDNADLAADAILALTPPAPDVRANEPASDPCRLRAIDDVRALREDVDFLLARSGHAGKCMFGGKRWTGTSSNALVSIAFGEDDPGLPSDSADLAACYRAVMRLPEHRRIPAVFDHLEAGEREVEAKYSGSIAEAREASEWPGRAALARGGKA